jgi:hypothetical protein
MSICPIFGRTILVATVLSLVGCSEMQRPPMNSTQADSYNQCMSTHWSSLVRQCSFRCSWVYVPSECGLELSAGGARNSSANKLRPTHQARFGASSCAGHGRTSSRDGSGITRRCGLAGERVATRAVTEI